MWGLFTVCIFTIIGNFKFFYSNIVVICTNYFEGKEKDFYIYLYARLFTVIKVNKSINLFLYTMKSVLFTFIEILFTLVQFLFTLSWNLFTFTYLSY